MDQFIKYQHVNATYSIFLAPKAPKNITILFFKNIKNQSKIGNSREVKDGRRYPLTGRRPLKKKDNAETLTVKY